LAVFLVLFVLGAIFGKSPEPAPAASPSSTTAAPTTGGTPAPVAETFTVATVTDGATFEVIGSNGTRKTVHVTGVATTGTAGDCFGAESLAWAGSKLAGRPVKLGADTAGSVTVTLADGQDYATLAVQNGYLKSTTAALSAAETAARQAAHGFWGPPCNGSVNLTTPAPQAPEPTSAPPAPSTKAAPKPPPVRTPTPEPPAPKPDTSSAYYANCSEARAAGVTPLHVGDPGYRPGLDRDHDGVACE
jgi:endonuclease YncB( thermonuclease family)